MAIIEITKARIIKAIKEEPILEAGQWVRAPTGTRISQLTKKRECSVCAVGSVFRNVLAKAQFTTAIYDAVYLSTMLGNTCPTSVTLTTIEREASLAAKSGRPMNALSIAFEGFWGLQERYPGETLTPAQIRLVRRQTIEFVKKHLPDTMQINIDGAKPARDVKVIVR